MEWYFVVSIIAGSIVFVVLLIYLGMKGVLGKSDVSIMSNISGALSALVSTIAAATENTAIDVMAFVMQLVKQAVYAAENLYYNNEITADERYEKCMEYLDTLLAEAKITMTDSLREIIEPMIKAACEELGHSVELGVAEENSENEAALADAKDEE
jgi:hypothetical protein